MHPACPEDIIQTEDGQIPRKWQVIGCLGMLSFLFGGWPVLDGETEKGLRR